MDGTGDDQIACFKEKGSIGARGVGLLREYRAKNMTKDGRNDMEEAGLSEDENEVQLDCIGDDDELLIEN